MIDIMKLNKECQELRSNSLALHSNACTKQWQNYMKFVEGEINHLSVKEASARLISEQNWMDRSQMKSSETLGIKVEIGDICFIDFGKAFVYEAGYQHFGLVVSKCNGKAFVIPMTSNTASYSQAYDEVYCPDGKRHLMRIGLVMGLNKPSVLFLNDAKYINTARIIAKKAHIPPKDPLFKDVMRRLVECLFLNGEW